MGLTSGTRLGPYEVLSALGAGGMGQVYKARDTRLDRIVAIKVLREPLADHPDRRARFEREARAISKLNHPHICTLYDVGRDNGTDYLVVEYLDGQTLADRLRKGPLPIDQALAIAIDIADALDAAHRAGIIHRDLKPANVMLTKSGAKLLDFGIARIPNPAPVTSASTQGTLTTDGALVGTVQYMSPEQLEGREADARSDIFAFGCVLYEMLNGRRAFSGETQAAVIAAVLEREPQPLAIRAMTFEHLVRVCLAKNPEERWQDARDVRRQLEALVQQERAVPVSRRNDHRSQVLWLFVAIVTAAIVASTWLVIRRWSVDTAPLLPSERLDIQLSPPVASVAALATTGGDRPVLALSPDGAQLVYVAQLGDQRTRLAVRDMTSGSTLVLAGTDGALEPFFAPDGRSIGFFADGKLKRIALEGQQVVIVADAPAARGGTWSQDGSIYFSRSEAEGIFGVPASGGPPRVVVAAAGILAPQLFPSGLLASTGGAIVAVENGHLRQLQPGGFGAVFVPGGYLLYALQGRLAAIALDRANHATRGGAVVLASDLRTAPYSVAQFAISTRGTLVYVPGTHQTTGSFVWVHLDGRVERLPLAAATYGNFSVSPDGRRIVAALTSESIEGGSDLWLYHTDRTGPARRFTPRLPNGDAARNSAVRWMPDGTHVIYWTADKTHAALIMANAENPDERRTLWERTPEGPTGLIVNSFSRDGSTLVGFGAMPDGRFRIYTMRFRGPDGTFLSHPVLEPWKASDFNEAFPEISPRGDAMAYSSDEPGQWEVYVSDYPNVRSRCRVTEGPATDPDWTPDGRAVIYQIGMTFVMREVKSIAHCEFGPVRTIVSGAFPDRDGYNHDHTADGRLLLVENPSTLQPAPTLRVITNVTDELRRRLSNR